MKDADKVNPAIEVQIGGETVKVTVDYQTLYNYDKETGTPLGMLFQNPNALFSVAIVVDFLYAAISHQNEKYTKRWIIDNMNSDVISVVAGKVIPEALKRAFGEAEEKKTTAKSQEK